MIRAYNHEKDLKAIQRIWREVGWIDDDNGEKQVAGFFSVGHAQVAELDGQPECSVHIAEGSVRLQHADLPLCAVTAVTTSRIARGHAFAQRLTARQLLHAHDQGAAVAALGMFDQGFYDKLGFGSGAYDVEVSLDPANLNVPVPKASPVRLTVDDAAEMHGAMVARKRMHGAVTLSPPELFRAELGFHEHAFGLGYRDARGDLTHFAWLKPEDERGPYRVQYMAYQDASQLLGLLGLFKSLADQVYSLILMEPPEIQLQSLIKRPMRHMQLTKGGQHKNDIRALAWWQLRVLDVARCVSALELPNGNLHFNLELHDPLTDVLDQYERDAQDLGTTWRGVGGQYTLKLGASSTAVPGFEPKLPVLRCNVNAFSRLLFGVADAQSLAITDAFTADADLLSALSQQLVLPRPVFGWDF